MSNLITVDESNFVAEVLEFKGKVLVDFYADWCGPCKVLAPELELLAAKYAENETIKICKIDTEANYDLSIKYKVSSIPNVAYFDSGILQEQIIGLKPASVYESKLTDELA